MAEATTGDKHAQARVVENGIIYLVADGKRKPQGFAAVPVLAAIRQADADAAALENAEGAIDGELAHGAAFVERAEEIGGAYRAAADELASTRERIAAGERRLAELRARAAGGRN